MSSVIERKDKLDKLFSGTDGLCEVYADITYNLEVTNIKFVFFGKNVSTPLLYNRLCSLGWYDVHMYYTEDSMSPALKGKKIIWREGRWYL